MSKPTDLVQGTLDLLILKVLAHQPNHGWAIVQRIRLMSNDVLQVGQGSLYPALHKLEHQGWMRQPGARATTAGAQYLLPHAGRPEGARCRIGPVGTALLGNLADVGRA